MFDLSSSDFLRKLGGSDRVIAVIVIVYGNTGPVLLREADRLIRFRGYISE